MASFSDQFSYIKKPFQNSFYTKENIDDLIKSSKDVIFFIEKFIKIQHPTKGSVNFHLYDYQKELIKTFDNYKYSIALTGRQLGKTTCCAAYILWKAIFVNDLTILIAANKMSSALEIMSRIRYMYEELPDFIKPGVTTYNKSSIEFDNKSRIISRPTTPDAGRGLSVSILYCLDTQTKVCVRNKISGKTETLSLEELFEKIQ